MAPYHQHCSRVCVHTCAPYRVLSQDLKDSLSKEAVRLESLRGDLNALKRATQNTILVHNRSVGLVRCCIGTELSAVGD